MRWIFLDPLNPQEAAYRAEKHRQIAAWWNAFAGKASDLEQLFRGRAAWDLPAWMQAFLQPIDEALMWEFGPAANGEGHRLVLTPEAHRHLRPLVNGILSRAPELPGWEFYGHRLPDPVDVALQKVQGRTGGDFTGARARIEAGDSGRVDLLFYVPQCSRPDDDEFRYQAVVAVESLLGEATLDAWIGAIRVEPFPKAGFFGRFRKSSRQAEPEGTVDLGELRMHVERLVAAHRNRLPAEPCWRNIDAAKWTVCELSPAPSDDFAQRDDLLLAATARPDVLEAGCNGGGFSSTRYSRCGETFCYVKFDRAAAADPDQFLDREPLENALNARLIPAGLGCSIGGGTGLRYSYIDVALTDLQRGVAALREALREQGLPPRSWVQFFDDDLAEEWVGIHSDAPPPPQV